MCTCVKKLEFGTHRSQNRTGYLKEHRTGLSHLWGGSSPVEGSRVTFLGEADVSLSALSK